MIYNDTTNLQGILQDIYFLGKCNSSTFQANDLLRIVNKYYYQLQEAVRSVNENFYMSEATTDLVIGDGSYTFPDGTGTAPAYEKIKSIWAAYLPVNPASPLASEYTRCDIIDPDSISDPEYTFSSDKPKVLVYGSYFVLLPLVTDVTKYPVTNGVKMYYIAQQTPLANASDVPNIFPDYHDAIVHGALIDVAERLGNDKLKADSVELFAKRIEDIKVDASNRLPAEISIVEGQETEGGWMYPFGNQNMA